MVLVPITNAGDKELVPARIHRPEPCLAMALVVAKPPSKNAPLTMPVPAPSRINCREAVLGAKLPLRVRELLPATNRVEPPPPVKLKAPLMMLSPAALEIAPLPEA